MAHRTMALFGAAVLALTIGGCERHKGATQADRAAIEQAIRADEAKWNRDFKAKDLNSLLGHFTPDVHVIAPGVAPASGIDQARKVIGDTVKDPAFDVTFGATKIDVAGSGDMAYARGRFTARWTDPRTKKVATGSGTYITVYRKQADGSWKVSEDITVPDPSPA